MKKLRYPVNADDHAYMAMRQKENRERCVHSGYENWMRNKLETTGLKWTRQARWGYRLFDFWNGLNGIAVEVDGPEHKPDYDAYRDRYNYMRSGIIVLRVRNLNESDAEQALQRIRENTETWKDRRIRMHIEVPKYDPPSQAALL